MIEKIKAKIKNADLGIGLDTTIKEEIRLLDETLPLIATAFEESVEIRRQWMLDTLESHKWDDLAVIGSVEGRSST
ncbi:hypothetical protein IH799_01840 [candidate division KSB1 bacterium]|nr:hypothetical protein [candidate division KSB1 bacterium]